MVFRTSSLIEIILFHKSKICINQRLYPSPHQPGEAFVTLWGFHFASDPFASQWGVVPYPPLFPRNEALSMVHLSLELCEKSRASSKQAGPAVFTVGLGGWRGRLREGPGAAEEEVAMGRAPQRHGMPVRSAGVGAGGTKEALQGWSRCFCVVRQASKTWRGWKVSAGAAKRTPPHPAHRLFLAPHLWEWVQEWKWRLAPMLCCSEVTFCTWMGSKGR